MSGQADFSFSEPDLRDRFERAANSLQERLGRSSTQISRNFASNEQTRAARLHELHELLCSLDDRALATDRDGERYNFLERWQSLGREDADRYRASCTHLRTRKPA